MAKLKLKKVTKQEEVAEPQIRLRYSVGVGVKWPLDVCMNPLRYLAMDCEGCCFNEPCICITKYDYKYGKKKRQDKEVNVDQESSENEEVGVLLAPPAPAKPKKESKKQKSAKKETKPKAEKVPSIKKKQSFDLDDYEFDL